MKRRMLTKTFLVVPAVAIAAVSTGTAVAALSSASGGAEIEKQTRSETVASATNATTFVDVVGANVTVSVPAGATELITARFAAESNCTRVLNPAGGGLCSARIVATRLGGGGTVELNPAAGIDYAFDAVATDANEGHAMERSLRLAEGNYRIRVQHAVNNAQVTSRLDDWHLAVEKNV
jgi:hypothetical protein